MHLEQRKYILKGLLTMKSFFTKLFSWLLIALNFILNLLGIPMLPNPCKTVDMSQFELVWSDEFDGTALDLNTWAGHYFWGDTPAKRRDGYWHLDMCKVKDGFLHIETAYKPEGMKGGPSGWYSCGIDTSASYEQTYGYFEARCQLPKGGGLWSAFWMFCGGVVNTAGEGEDGTEIDIFESPYYKKLFKNTVAYNLHYNGYDEAHKMMGAEKFFVDKPYDSFHTYGLEWNENEYIFYIDGKECGRTNYGGVSKVPEWLILSVETVNDGWTKDINETTGKPTDFIVDYVRAYQYKPQ